MVRFTLIRQRFQYILSRGVTVAQQTLTLLVIVQSDPAQPWRHSSVVEHAAVNRAVVGSSPTAASMYTGFVRAR